MSNNKTNPNEPANATVKVTEYGDIGAIDGGLTKREYFAAMALQGICANSNSKYWEELSPKYAVEIADELIKALNNE